MLRDQDRTFAVYQSRGHRLERQWQELCALYLPLTMPDSIWRYHHVRGPEEPAQGWKLHLSATVLNACQVLAQVAPFLVARGVQFKAPRSLNELMRINSGLFYGYSQVGKVITVYPRTPEEAVSLARQLHKLTHRLPGPAVPFDLRLSEASNVYYRFGAFSHLEMESEDGAGKPAIKSPDGELVPDVRTNERGRPDWATDPFKTRTARRQRKQGQNQLAQSFRVFRALVQRGKGGVYQALDMRADPPRLCLLKEGRKDGELTWDGRDGAWRVRNEERVLAQLRSSGVVAPLVYSSFELGGNYYLVTEFIAGESLHNLLVRLKARMPVARALRFGLRLALVCSQIHAAGWVWRDCKPTNIIVTPDGRLRPLDFEGACRAEAPDPMLWATPGFTPPECREMNLKTGIPHDLYALGSMLYLLLTGRVPAETDPLPITRLRRNVPPEICALVFRLLSPEPARRPAAATVAEQLEAALSLAQRN